VILTWAFRAGPEKMKKNIRIVDNNNLLLINYGFDFLNIIEKKIHY